jgi:hypothetical protein
MRYPKKMQRVPENLLQARVSYRVHQEGTDTSIDLLGSLFKKNVFCDGDVRYLLDRLVVPVHLASWDSPVVKGSHSREDPDWLRSIDPVNHTFYVTAQNLWVQRIIAAKTGRLVQCPLITQYF